MSTKVEKVIVDGETVYDISGGTIEPPPPPEGSITFAFAEIPEQVFVYGYADEEDMNIYHLDTLNLFPSGSMPWDGAHGFTPRLKCDVIDPLPAGVTWDRDDGKFVWDGRTGTNTVVSVKFFQAETNQVSDPFEVKVLNASVEWAYSDENISLETKVNSVLPDASGYNVILIKDGEYQDIQLRDVGNGYMNCFRNLGNVYVIGEPDTMPILSGNHLDWPNLLDYDPDDWVSGQSFRMRLDGTKDHVHLKGIELRYATIQTIGDGNTESTSYVNFFINKVKLHSHQAKSTGIMFDYIYADDPDSMPRFISNYETYWMGGSGTNHAIYNHSAPYYSDEDLAENPKAITYLNNYKAYEMKRAVNIDLEVYGGQLYKDFSNKVKIRNSFFSLTKDPSAIASMTAADWLKLGASPLLVLHAHMDVVLYNNEFHGWNCDSTSQPDYLSTGKKLYRGVNSLVNFQNRGLTPGVGALWPPYFSYPAVGTPEDNDTCRRYAAYGSWENFEFTCTYDGLTHYATKDPVYHGVSNSTTDYTATGVLGDENPNPSYAPVDSDFWTSVGDPSDPENPLSFPKFIVHNRFYFYSTVPYVKKICNGLQVHSSVPKDAIRQFSDIKDFLPVPPNWVERNWLFTCNNTFTGFGVDSRLKTIEMGHAEAIRYKYPYAPDQVAVVANNRTDAGGEINDSVGEQIAIPDWFNI